MPLQLVSQSWIELVHIFAHENPDIRSYCFKYLPEELKPKNKNILKSFCLAITYQAISTTVCDQMWKRFTTLMCELGYINDWPPEIVASLSDEQLRNTVKLSQRK